MAEIIVDVDGTQRTLPLSASTLLGRHHQCTWRIGDPRLPLYWIELRWIGRRWGWRVLADPGNTRGPLTAMPGNPHWRVLGQGERVYTPRASITLAAGGPPRRFAVDLDTDDVLQGEALDEYLEERADGPWPVDAEQRDALRGPLSDGRVFVSCGRPLRLFIGEPIAETVRGGISLMRSSCALYIDIPPGEEPRLSVVDRDAEVVLQGAYVRACVPYARARSRDLPVDGWLTIHDAHYQWQQHGGSAASGSERIAQDRSRLCRALAKAGVVGAHSLFETQRKGQWYTRLCLPPSRVHVDDG